MLRDHPAALSAEAGTAGRDARLMLGADPPDLDAGGITDKGYLNQAVVSERRADLAERFYADVVDPEVVTPR